jgi:hypothetical protein
VNNIKRYGGTVFILKLMVIVKWFETIDRKIESFVDPAYNLVNQV